MAVAAGLLGLVLCASVLGLPQPPPARASLTTSVEQAEADLERAQAAAAEANARLDALAQAFESSRAHAETLAGELGGAEEALDLARADVQAAEEARRAQIRAAYKQPGIDLLRVSGAFLFAPDVGSALHTTALMHAAAAARVEVLRRLQAAGRRLVTDLSTQQGVSAGTAAAMEDVRELSTIFEGTLEQAAAEVARAEAVLEEARALAIERERLAQLQGFTGSFGVAPPPVLREATIPGGTQVMTCPLGQPNGFIDSWGFPRSGGRRHQGVDMFAAHGMPVVAVADGVVSRVFNNALGGLSIDLIDGLGNRYYYAHLSAAFVSSGQRVTVGELLAANGNSGNAIATPPHLHWQFHPGSGGPVNPYPLAAALCR